MARVKTTDFRAQLQTSIRAHIEKQAKDNDLVGPQSAGSLLSVDEMTEAVLDKVMAELDTVSPEGTRDGTWASKAEVDHLVERFSGLAEQLRSTHAQLRAVGDPGASQKFLTDLKKFVQTPGALGYTPQADRHGANETNVAILSFTGGHDDAVTAMRAKIKGEFAQWADDPADFSPFDAAWLANAQVDMLVQENPNLGGAQMRAFLTETTRDEHRRGTAPEGAPTVEDVLDGGFLGKIAHVGLQDIGAEVIGNEALILTPEGSNESTVLFFDYVHA